MTGPWSVEAGWDWAQRNYRRVKVWYLGRGGGLLECPLGQGVGIFVPWVSGKIGADWKQYGVIEFE